MPNQYDKGRGVKFWSRFSVDGVPINPTTVTLKVKDPAGVTTPYTGAALQNPETGYYTKEITLGAEGFWYYRWESTGTCVAAEEGYCEVGPSEF